MLEVLLYSKVTVECISVLSRSRVLSCLGLYLLGALSLRKTWGNMQQNGEGKKNIVKQWEVGLLSCVGREEADDTGLTTLVLHFREVEGE